MIGAATTTERGVALLVATCALLLGLSHALLNPYLQGPDELAHVDLVHALAEGEGWPAVGDREIDDRFFDARSRLGWQKDTYQRTIAAAPVRGQRGVLTDFGEQPDIDEINPATQHPPLYYVAVASVSEAVAPVVFAVAERTTDRMLFLQRLVNVLAIALAAYVTVRAVARLGGGDREQLLAGGLLLTLPQLVYIGSAVNNDNGVVLGFAATLAVGAAAATGDTRARVAVLLGVVAAATAASKSFGLVAVGWAPLAFVPLWLRDRSRRRATLRAAVVTAVVGGVLGVAWWVANVVRYGTVQPRALERAPAPPLEGYDHGFLDWLVRYVPANVQSFVGDFGYLDAPVPPWIAWLVVTIGVVLLGWATIAAWRRREQRWLLLLLVPLVLVGAALAAFNYLVVIEELGGRIAGAQGRYLFGAVPPTAALIALVLARRRWLVGGVVVLAVAVQVVGLRTMVDAFYAGDTLLARLRAAGTWAPWPPAVSIAAAVLTGLALAALVTAAVAVERRAVRPAGAVGPPR